MCIMQNQSNDQLIELHLLSIYYQYQAQQVTFDAEVIEIPLSHPPKTFSFTSAAMIAIYMLLVSNKCY